MAKLSPVFNDQTVDINGNPLSGAKVFTYAAGSSTKISTFTDAAGVVPQTNPIILNSLGYPTNGPIWLTEGVQTKFVLAPATDTDPPTSPIRTIDHVQGVNDSSVALSQWTASGVTPTYVSISSFTLPGDQTSAFEIGRRVQFTTSGGTVYGTIQTSVFTTLTTITVQMDGAQVLDSGLSVVNLGVLTATNPSYPSFIDTSFRVVDDADKTKKATFQASGITTGTTRAFTFPDRSGTLALTDDIKQIQSVTSSVAANALTLNYAGGSLDFRATSLNVGTPIANVSVAANSIVIPSGATLGTVSGVAARLALLEFYNGGSPVAGVANVAGGVQLDETNLLSPTTISAGATLATVVYSASAVGANSPYRVVGIFDITEAAAGTWATDATLKQGVGGQAFAALSSIGYGQTWQAVTRNSGTTYYNTTGKPIEVMPRVESNAANPSITIVVNNTTIFNTLPINTANPGYAGPTPTFIVPPHQSYVITVVAAVLTVSELR